MRPRESLLSLVLNVLLLAACLGPVGAQGTVSPAAEPGGGAPGDDGPLGRFPERPPVAQRMKLTLPGSGFPIDELGRLDPGGALQISIPIGYTLSDEQWDVQAWGTDNDDEGWVLQSGLTFGFGSRGAGLSLTAVGADRGNEDSITGHVQKQLWPETRFWPAVSAGVFDVVDNYERSYYVAATKRLGKRHPKRMTVRAGTMAWPAMDESPSSTDPSTWGTLRLLDRRTWPEDDPDGPQSLTVPLSSFPAHVDGMLGGEWDDAAQVKLDLPDSQYMLLGAKHNGAVLFVAVGIPSDRYVSRGALVELCFEVPGSRMDTLGPTHVRYALRWPKQSDMVDHVRGQGSEGRWINQVCAPDRTGATRRFTGALSNQGDGAWHYPVFEFAIPLAELGVEPGGEPIGFAVLTDLPAGQHKAFLDRTSEYRAQWPTGRGSYSARSAENTLFAQRPDRWGSVLLADRAAGATRIAAPEVETAPQIDGLLAEGEWRGADTEHSEICPGVDQLVHVQRSQNYLCIASVWEISAGIWVDQVLDVLLDPMGDGGLWPRGDDRLLRVTSSGDTVRLESYSWHETLRRWITREQLAYDAAFATSATPTGTTSVVELRVAMKDLGVPTRWKGAPAIGMGLEAAVTAAPARMVRPGSYVETGSGKSTYITAGWGTGVYEDKVNYGISHPLGSYRAVAEYDGAAINYGLTGPFPGWDDLRLTVGMSDPRDGGPTTTLIGTGLVTRF